MRVPCLDAPDRFCRLTSQIHPCLLDPGSPPRRNPILLPARMGRCMPVLFGVLVVFLHPGIAGAQAESSSIDSLQSAITRVDQNDEKLIIELPLIEVPGDSMVLTPVFRATVPFDVSLYGSAVAVVDEQGLPSPSDRLHHFVMTDPTRRGLFLPLALPIFGASKESPWHPDRTRSDCG